jgi:uncharacterized protein (DUF885 family)
MSRLRPTLRLGMALLCAAWLWPAAAADGDGARRLHALFNEYWSQTARDYPEWATWRGDHRFDDRLTDATPAARDARDARERDWLARARAIDRDALTAVDRVSLDVFVHQRDQEVTQQDFGGWRTMSLGSQGGFHTELAQLLQMMPMRNALQVEQYLARLAAAPRRIDEEIVWLKRGIALGWVGPRPVLERVLGQIDAQLQAPLASSSFLEPLQRISTEMTAAQRAAYAERARATLQMQLLPALQRLRDFVAADYLAAAPADGALGGYPGGDAVYRAQIAVHTTLSLSARQLHDLGLREVARLQREIEGTYREAGFDGGVAQWVRHLNTDPKYFHTSGDALLAGYREIAKRIDPELPRLFAELPRMPYGVRAMPAHRGADNADYYDGPALDGSRPGWFNANVQAWHKQPTWAMESLVAHEAVPGHHLQSARAVELGELPAFRRDVFFTAFVEGWALYAETLGTELGLYRDAPSRFGHLQMQVFRAARMVVDTGIHAFGWSRERAIDYLVQHTALDRDLCAAEVDRYTSWPGQALAYMSGQLKIIELRDRSRAAMGEAFDIRRFHNVVLDQGALPLPVLERVVDEWIATTAARRGGAVIEPQR